MQFESLYLIHNSTLTLFCPNRSAYLVWESDHDGTGFEIGGADDKKGTKINFTCAGYEIDTAEDGTPGELEIDTTYYETTAQ